MFFALTLDGDWDDFGLSARSCHLRIPSVSSADRASTPRVFSYILGIVARVDGANRPQVLKLRVLRRLKRDFDCRWVYEEGRGPVFSAHSGVTY